MSADEKRAHNNGPEKDNRPVVSGAILAWMPQKGCADFFPPDEELGPPLAEPPEQIAESCTSSDDIVGTLLKAIQSTEVAAKLERTSAPGFGPFVALDPPRTANVAFDSPVKGEQPPEPVPQAIRPAKPGRSPAAAKRRRVANTQAEVAPPTAPAPGKAPHDPTLFPPTEISGTAPVPVETAQPVRSRRSAQAGAKTRRSSTSGKPRSSAMRRVGSSAQEALPAPAFPVVETASEAALAPPVATAPPVIQVTPQAVVVAAPPPLPTEPLPVFLAPMLPVSVKPAATETAPVVEVVPAAIAEAAAIPPATEPAPVEDGATKTSTIVRINGDTGLLTHKVGLAAERLSRAGKQLSTLFESFFQPRESRRNWRLIQPPLIAYPWAAGSREAQTVVNISSSGLYLQTEERWPPGGTLCMTLQRTDKARGSPASWIVVEFMVVRWCSDGLAGTFIPSLPGRSYAVIGRAENCADEKSLHRFIKQLAPVAHPTAR